MKVKGTFVVVLSFLLLYLPVAPIDASSAAGKMITKGTAEINGVAAPAVTSVFVGDRIATEMETTTSLSFTGGDAVVMPQLTKAALGKRDGHLVVNLEEGTVSVMNKSHTPIVVEAHGARIRAASNRPAIYDVTIHGNALRVVTHGGAARVETANRSGEVQPGNALEATLAPNPPPPATSAGSSTGTWVLVGSAAMGATGLALGAVALDKVDNCTLSPSTNTISC
jgi:ferric-dicitrate binding protein FerR (iron transport regulator)